MVTRKKALVATAWNIEPTVLDEAPELGMTLSLSFGGYITDSGLCPKRNKLLKDFKCSRQGVNELVRVM